VQSATQTPDVSAADPPSAQASFFTSVTTDPVAGSTRTTDLVLRMPTQTASPVAATALGPKSEGLAPRATLSTIALSRGSMRTTEPLGDSVVPQVFATQTASGVTAMPRGPELNCVGEPSGIGTDTRFNCGSIRRTLLDSPSTTHKEP